jgi:hypothetical protein
MRMCQRNPQKFSVFPLLITMRPLSFYQRAHHQYKTGDNMMTYTEYRAQIDAWTELATKAGVTLSDGEPLPVTYWKTFLGLKRKVHQDMYNGTHRTKFGLVPEYIARSIVFANRLEQDAFFHLVMASIPKFEQDRSS